MIKSVKAELDDPFKSSLEYYKTIVSFFEKSKTWSDHFLKSIPESDTVHEASFWNDTGARPAIRIDVNTPCPPDAGQLHYYMRYSVRINRKDELEFGVLFEDEKEKKFKSEAEALALVREIYTNIQL